MVRLRQRLRLRPGAGSQLRPGILLPLVAPSLASGMLLVFAPASRKLVASLRVAPVGMQSIATFIWRQFDQGSVGVGMVMALIAIAVTTILPQLLIAGLRRAFPARTGHRAGPANMGRCTLPRQVRSGAERL